METKKVIIVVGARPNFMKATALLREFKNHSKFISVLVHTGQHYDDDMSATFFYDLKLPKSDMYLGIESGTQAEQTGKIMIAFERTCLKEKPDLLIVVGDVNSTIACALVAAKMGIPIAHVEAGLRSFDRTMPEEINRVLTDQLSDFLFTTCEDANENLKKEGIPENKIYYVGNVMIDTLTRFIERAKKSDIIERLMLKTNGNTCRYAVVTLHRPSNVDSADKLKGILSALNQLSKSIPVLFPAHPRTLKRLKEFKLENLVAHRADTSVDIINSNQLTLLIPPLSYMDFLCLMANATIVLTDSGGIQEETTVLGIPCLTLRNNTERPVTVREGTNIVIGNNPDEILWGALNYLKAGPFRKTLPKYWDGKAAERIVKILRESI